MDHCIWYVSKYVSPPAKASAGGRGFMIMRELSRVGYRCVIITSDSNQLAEVPIFTDDYFLQEIDGVRLCWIRTLKYTVAKSLRRIISWLDFEWRLWRLPKQQFPVPDVVIVSSLSLLTILNGFMLRAQYNCRLVLEIRDIWPLTIVEEGGFSRWNPLVMGLGFIERLGYRFADAIVGTMPNLSEHVVNVLGHEKETYCIPMGVDEDVLMAAQSLPDDYVKAYIPQGKFIVAHVGSIGITNALDVFFECAQAMKDDDYVHFLIVGEGDLRSYYQEQYAQLTNLTFAPKVPKLMVQSVLVLCDLLYFSVYRSNVWTYGQSLNKVIDYMLSGKPVIASYTGYPSMINEAGCGSYVPAGDLSALIQEVRRYADMDSSERIALGQRGRQWLLENRRYEDLARDYLSILFPRRAQDSL